MYILITTTHGRGRSVLSGICVYTIRIHTGQENRGGGLFETTTNQGRHTRDICMVCILDSPPPSPVHMHVHGLIECDGFSLMMIDLDWSARHQGMEENVWMGICGVEHTLI